MRLPKLICGILILTAMLQLNCASSMNPLSKVEQTENGTAKSDSISEKEIQLEMRSANRALYATSLSLGFGAIGLFAGAKIGYEIGYSHDIKKGEILYETQNDI